MPIGKAKDWVVDEVKWSKIKDTEFITRVVIKRTTKEKRATFTREINLNSPKIDWYYHEFREDEAKLRNTNGARMRRYIASGAALLCVVCAILYKKLR